MLNKRIKRDFLGMDKKPDLEGRLVSIVNHTRTNSHINYPIPKKLDKEGAWQSYRNGNFVPNRQDYFHMQTKN